MAPAHQLDSEEVKRQSSLARVIRSYGVELKPFRDGQYMACCPFHEDGTPSMSVSDEKGVFNCFGCAVAGDVFTFVARMDSLSFAEAVSRVAELEGYVPAGQPRLQPATRQTPSGTAVEPARPRPEPKKNPDSRMVATYPYVDRHGNLLYEVQRWEPGRQLYFDSDSGAWRARKKDFSQRHRGSDGNWVYDMQGVERVLFRLPEVLQSERIFFVEGEKDVLSIEDQGGIATTNAGGVKAKWESSFTEALAGKTVIIVPDTDQPGLERGRSLVEELKGRARRVLLIILPDGSGKDVTEYFEKGHTLTDLEQLVHAQEREIERVEIEKRGLLSLREIALVTEGGSAAFLDPSKRKKGVMTGFSKFDEMTLGMHEEQLIIIAARPAMGKTAFALNIADHVARNTGPVGVFSLEMSKESLVTRLVCAAARVDQMKFAAGYLNREERHRMGSAWRDLEQLPLYIDDRPSAGLEDMHWKLHGLKDRDGLALVIVDYLQLMGSSERKRNENREQEVSTLSRGLKLMAKELRVPFVVLSQLSRAPETRPGDHRPQLSDLRESGAIEQHADLVGFIFREEVYKPDREDLRGVAELIIGKQRNGPTGKIKLAFMREYTRFQNITYEMPDGPPPVSRRSAVQDTKQTGWLPDPVDED